MELCDVCYKNLTSLGRAQKHVLEWPKMVSKKSFGAKHPPLEGVCDFLAGESKYTRGTPRQPQ